MDKLASSFLAASDEDKTGVIAEVRGLCVAGVRWGGAELLTVPARHLPNFKL